MQIFLNRDAAYKRGWNEKRAPDKSSALYLYNLASSSAPTLHTTSNTPHSTITLIGFIFTLRSSTMAAAKYAMYRNWMFDSTKLAVPLTKKAEINPIPRS